jgi:hypothetical protein
MGDAFDPHGLVTNPSAPPRSVLGVPRSAFTASVACGSPFEDVGGVHHGTGLSPTDVDDRGQDLFDLNSGRRINHDEELVSWGICPGTDHFYVRVHETGKRSSERFPCSIRIVVWARIPTMCMRHMKQHVILLQPRPTLQTEPTGRPQPAQQKFSRTRRRGLRLGTHRGLIERSEIVSGGQPHRRCALDLIVAGLSTGQFSVTCSRRFYSCCETVDTVEGFTCSAACLCVIASVVARAASSSMGCGRRPSSS